MPDPSDSCSHPCARCVTLAAEVERQRAVIADQARTLERVTSELRWHGLDDGALTVGAAYLAWRRAMRDRSAWRQYRSRLLPFVWRFRHRRCLQLGPGDWADYMRARRSAKVGRWKAQTIKASTLDSELKVAKMLFVWLVKAQLLPRSPLAEAKGTGEPHGRETWLPGADLDRLLAAITGDDRRALMLRAFIQVAFRTGLRFETVRKLRRDRIGPDGILELSAKRTKSKRRHTVAIPELAMRAIEAVPPVGGSPFVFAHEWLGRVAVISAKQLRVWFYRACRDAGVDALAAEGDERIKPHDLRHSAASHLEVQGAHLLDIRDFLDHATAGTTERYMHRRPAQKALAMADLMGGRAGPQRHIAQK